MLEDHRLANLNIFSYAMHVLFIKPTLTRLAKLYSTYYLYSLSVSILRSIGHICNLKMDNGLTSGSVWVLIKGIGITL